RLLDRGQWIGLVQLIEIDPVGLQAFETGFDGGQDVTPRGSLSNPGVIHRHAEFGCEHNVLAAVAETFPQIFLWRTALAVDVRGIEKRDAEIEGPVHDLARRREIDPAAEIVAA